MSAISRKFMKRLFPSLVPCTALSFYVYIRLPAFLRNFDTAAYVQWKYSAVSDWHASGSSTKWVCNSTGRINLGLCYLLESFKSPVSLNTLTHFASVFVERPNTSAVFQYVCPDSRYSICTFSIFFAIPHSNSILPHFFAVKKLFDYKHHFTLDFLRNHGRHCERSEASQLHNSIAFGITTEAKGF